MGKTNKYLPVLLLFFFSTNVFGQLELKLAMLPDSTGWGVYIQPNESINPSLNTITGSGQITLVVPSGYHFGKFENKAGLWDMNTIVNAPVENPTKDYISFGFSTDNPPITIQKGQETLLFTLERITPCPSELHLIDNDLDPFASLPNSYGSNPGNEISIIDVNRGTQYFYTKNYDMCAWSCGPCEELSNTTNINDSELEIFPNPNDGAFQIDLGSNESKIDRIKIFNTIGKLILSKEINSSQLFFDENLKSGMYLISFEIDNKPILTKRIVISN